MNVVHHDIKEYFLDLKSVKDEGDIAVVRSECFTMSRDEQGGVKDVRVVSGFYSKNHFYELTFECGEILAGGSDQEAYRQAESIIQEISLECAELGFRHGGGQWQSA